MNGVEVLCLGELMLDMVAREAADGSITGFDMKPGGAAGNVAVAAGRLGLRPGVIAKVSGDFFGRVMKKTMEDEGVDTTALVMDPDRKIVMAFVTYDDQKKPDYLFYRENAASASLGADEIRPEWFDGAKVLYYSSMGLVRDPLRTANYQAAKLAAEAGARIAFDPNIRFGVWPSREAVREQVLKMMELVNICKMNDEEMAFLFGEGDIAARCRGIMSAFPRMELVAITLGAEGAFLMNRAGEWARVGALANDVVDTMGAGDSFFAALLERAVRSGFRYESRQQLRTMLEYANAAALLTARRPGAIPAMPRAEEVERLRREYDRMI